MPLTMLWLYPRDIIDADKKNTVTFSVDSKEDSDICAQYYVSVVFKKLHRGTCYLVKTISS